MIIRLSVLLLLAQCSWKLSGAASAPHEAHRRQQPLAPGQAQFAAAPQEPTDIYGVPLQNSQPAYYAQQPGVVPVPPAAESAGGAQQGAYSSSIAADGAVNQIQQPYAAQPQAMQQQAFPAQPIAQQQQQELQQPQVQQVQARQPPQLLRMEQGPVVTPATGGVAVDASATQEMTHTAAEIPVWQRQQQREAPPAGPVADVASELAAPPASSRVPGLHADVRVLPMQSQDADDVGQTVTYPFANATHRGPKFVNGKIRTFIVKVQKVGKVRKVRKVGKVGKGRTDEDEPSEATSDDDDDATPEEATQTGKGSRHGRNSESSSEDLASDNEATPGEVDTPLWKGQGCYNDPCEKIPQMPCWNNSCWIEATGVDNWCADSLDNCRMCGGLWCHGDEKEGDVPERRKEPGAESHFFEIGSAREVADNAADALWLAGVSKRQEPNSAGETGPGSAAFLVAALAFCKLLQ